MVSLNMQVLTACISILFLICWDTAIYQILVYVDTACVPFIVCDDFSTDENMVYLRYKADSRLQVVSCRCVAKHVLMNWRESMLQPYKNTFRMYWSCLSFVTCIFKKLFTLKKDWNVIHIYIYIVKSMWTVMVNSSKIDFNWRHKR